MTKPLFIGIDIGTQGTKAVVTDKYGDVLAESFKPSRLCYSDGGGIYEEPQDILDSVIYTILEVSKKIGAEKSQNIKAIGIDSQMAGIMGIGKSFEAVTYYDSWLDGRCSEYTKAIEAAAGDDAILKSGGQIINSHAAKILWWKNERPEIYEKIEKFVMPGGFVSGILCGLKSDDAFMDYTFLHFNNFSDNENLCFNQDMLSLFSVSAEKLPRIVKPYDIIGTVTGEYAAKCSLPDGVQIIAGCGDTAASSLGAGITETGLAYDVAGTASVFACCTDKYSPDVEHKTILYSRSVIDNLFLPLAYISGGGLCLKWFSSLVKSDLKSLDKRAEGIPAGSGGVTFIPHFSGRTCPLDNNVSGAFLGLRSDTDEASMYRAVMEAVAFEYKSYLDILTDSGSARQTNLIYGVGGGAKSTVFSKIKSDTLGIDYLPLEDSSSAAGAVAVLSAFGTGYRKKPLKELFKSEIKEKDIIHTDQRAHEILIPYAKKYLRLLNGYSLYTSKANEGDNNYAN